MGYLAAGFKVQGANCSRRIAEVERSVLAAEKERAYKSDKALKTVMALISQKDGELESAWAALAEAEVKPLWMLWPSGLRPGRRPR